MPRSFSLLATVPGSAKPSRFTTAARDCPVVKARAGYELKARAKGVVSALVERTIASSPLHNSRSGSARVLVSDLDPAAKHAVDRALPSRQGGGARVVRAAGTRRATLKGRVRSEAECDGPRWWRLLWWLWV